MPEHVYLLINTPLTEAVVGHFIARLKQPFSKQIKQILGQSRSNLLSRLTVQERPGKRCFRFWQEGPGYDRNLFSGQAIAAFLDYIHENPVKRGLCVRAIDWKWSSARFYESDGVSVDLDLPKLHKLPSGCLD